MAATTAAAAVLAEEDADTEVVNVNAGLGVDEGAADDDTVPDADARRLSVADGEFTVGVFSGVTESDAVTVTDGDAKAEVDAEVDADRDSDVDGQLEAEKDGNADADADSEAVADGVSTVAVAAADGDGETVGDADA